jgi:6-phosphogluconolactonase
MRPDIITAPDAEQTADQMAQRVMIYLNNRITQTKYVSIALSGGNTPKLLFQIFSDKYSTQIQWQRIHIYWCDERCVPPDHADSNYGMTKQYLLNHNTIPEQNIHRIEGESDPIAETIRYAKEVNTFVKTIRGLPAFDWILLGMGEDGHTASIFPDQMELLTTEKLTAVAVHPQSGQKRITLTGRIINNADWITFLVTGNNKAELVSKILKQDSLSLNFPAAKVEPNHGRLEWYLDSEAASRI